MRRSNDISRSWKTATVSGCFVKHDAALSDKRGTRPVARRGRGELKVNEARRRVQGWDREETGTVRFSTTGTMVDEIVAPLLARFAKTYPDIELEISVSDKLEDINRLQTDVSQRYATTSQMTSLHENTFRWRSFRWPAEPIWKATCHLQGDKAKDCPGSGGTKQNATRNGCRTAHFRWPMCAVRRPTPCSNCRSHGRGPGSSTHLSIFQRYIRN